MLVGMLKRLPMSSGKHSMGSRIKNKFHVDTIRKTTHTPRNLPVNERPIDYINANDPGNRVRRYEIVRTQLVGCRTPVQRFVYARHGHEFVGLKSPV